MYADLTSSFAPFRSFTIDGHGARQYNYIPANFHAHINLTHGGEMFEKKRDIDNHSAETRLSSDSDEIVKNILIKYSLHNGSISECLSADE